MPFHESERPQKRQRTEFAHFPIRTVNQHEQSPSDEDISEEHEILDEDEDQWQSQARFRHRMEEIFQRYSVDNTDEADEINIRTGAILVNRGHLTTLPDADIEDDYDSFTSDEDGVVDDHDEDILDFLQTPAKAVPEWLDDSSSSSSPPTPVLWNLDDDKRPLSSLNLNELPSEETILRQFGPAGPAVLEVLKKQAEDKAAELPLITGEARAVTMNNNSGEVDDLTLLITESSATQTPLKSFRLSRSDCHLSPSARLHTLSNLSTGIQSAHSAGLLGKYFALRSCSPKSARPKSHNRSRTKNLVHVPVKRKQVARTTSTWEDCDPRLANSHRIREKDSNLINYDSSDNSSDVECMTFRNRDEPTDDEFHTPLRLSNSEAQEHRLHYGVSPRLSTSGTELLTTLEEPRSTHFRETLPSCQGSIHSATDLIGTDDTHLTSLASKHSRAHQPFRADDSTGDPSRPYKCPNEDCTSIFSTARGVSRHLKRGTCDTRPYTFECVNQGCHNVYRTKSGRNAHVADYCPFASIKSTTQSRDIPVEDAQFTSRAAVPLTGRQEHRDNGLTINTRGDSASSRVALTDQQQSFELREVPETPDKLDSRWRQEGTDIQKTASPAVRQPKHWLDDTSDFRYISDPASNAADQGRGPTSVLDENIRITGVEDDEPKDVRSICAWKKI